MVRLGGNPQPHCPFNGDTFIGPEIKRLVEKYGVKTIIETGTWSAHTTRELATYGVPVITIDSTHEHLYEEFGPQAKMDLLKRGVRCYVGDSATDLGYLIRKSAAPIFFYLDAHGGGANGSNVNPLLEELDQIGDARYMTDDCLPVIAIHDFKVPDKGFGYNGGDWGRGFEPLSYGLIQSRIEKIYPNGHLFHYNQQADGATRGVIYVYPR